MTDSDISDINILIRQANFKLDHRAHLFGKS